MKEQKELYAIIRKRHTFLSYNEKKLFEKIVTTGNMAQEAKQTDRNSAG